MNRKQAQRLLKKYREGLSTDLENQIIDEWIKSEYMLGSWEITDEEKKILNLKLKSRIDKKKKSSVVFSLEKMKYRISAAAVLFLFIFAVIYFNGKKVDQVIVYANDIQPGGNKAWLTLADGKKIDLSKVDSGAVIVQQGVQIFKMGDGKISFRIKPSTSDHTIGYNTIETPRGGQYQIELPDGTNIRLNAASTIRYSSDFMQAEQRIVELEGEAYFEVTKDRRHPFLVRSHQQELQVLGTQFNVNAYAEEKRVETTLVTGSIKLHFTNSEHRFLQIKPGEKATLKGQNFEYTALI